MNQFRSSAPPGAPSESGEAHETAEKGEVADPLIRAEGIRKSYGPVPAVVELSFQVRRGEILGLLGPNGAGKSTTLRILVGFQYPDAGRVWLHGRDVFQEGPLARASLGYLPESVPLYGEMTVESYLTFFARLRPIDGIREAVRKVVDLCDLGPVLGRPCANLSRGYRQRVGLGQALLHDPAVLILDEPTSGLDPNQIHDFRSLLRALGRDRAVLLSTHILPEALEICDRVLIMSRGRKVAEGSPQDLASRGPSLHWARIRAMVPPSPEELEQFGLALEAHSGVYRVERELDREASRALLRLVAERDWELVEWRTGAAGLESVFRRLTLGEEEP